MIVWWTLPIVGAFGLAVGVAAAHALMSRHRVRPPTAGVEAPTATNAEPATASPVRPARAEDDLAQLARSVIEARDLAEPSSVLARRLGTALAMAGFSEFLPLGEPYDTERHYAVGTESAPDRSKVDLIAEVQRVGYLHDHEVIRPAEVVVYRLEPVT